MMYCPRCNNTHWIRTKRKTILERISLLALKRPYRCKKCDRVQLGSIFLDFTLSGPRKPKRKIARDKKDSSDLKCPECGGNVRRSHRRGLERVLFFTRAYRCFDCEARFRTIKL
jgi:hypothetical protein